MEEKCPSGNWKLECMFAIFMYIVCIMHILYIIYYILYIIYYILYIHICAYIIYYIYIYVHKPLGCIYKPCLAFNFSTSISWNEKKNTWKAPSLLKNHSSLSGTHPLGLSYLLMSGLAKAQHVGAKVKFDVRGLSNNLVTKPHRVDVSSSGFGWFESMGLFFRWSWNTGKTPETLHNKRYMLR